MTVDVSAVTNNVPKLPTVSLGAGYAGVALSAVTQNAPQPPPWAQHGEYTSPSTTPVVPRIVTKRAEVNPAVVELCTA